MIALLDVSVLVALFNGGHKDHDAAHDWFHDSCTDGWASCPLTENGLLRVLGNPTQRSGYLPLGELLTRLRRFCSSSDHHFWADSISFRDPDVFDMEKIRGQRQLTDVYLLALAAKRNGRLVTFDQRVPLAAVKGARREHLEVIRPG